MNSAADRGEDREKNQFLVGRSLFSSFFFTWNLYYKMKKYKIKKDIERGIFTGRRFS